MKTGRPSVAAGLCASTVFLTAGLACGRPAEITDFREPHPWNASPWRVGGGSFSNGVWSVDFSRRSYLSLLNSIDIPFVPSRFYLTVEAPAEAARAQLTMILGEKDTWIFKAIGELREAAPGESVVRQTLEVDGDLVNGCTWEEHGERFPPRWKQVRLPARLIGFWCQRNGAKSSRFDLRMVAFSADPLSDAAGPIPLMVPPAGESPPERLLTRVVNATTADYPSLELAVAVEDWNGHTVGVSRVELKDLTAGETRVVDVPACPYPKGRNYFRFLPTCRVSADAESGGGSGTSWTRPVASSGSRELRPDLPWGMNMCLTRPLPGRTVEERAELAGRCGIRWDRMILSTGMIRPDGKTWDWSQADRMVGALNANGISIFVLLGDFPAWTNPYSEESYAAYLEIAKAAAKRYRGKVHGWEIWNEPNIFFWRGPKSEYFQLVDRAFEAIRSVDPKVPVVAISAASMPNMKSFVEDFLASGARYSDVSIHTYGCFPEKEFLSRMDEFSGMVGGRKVWVSEMGWSTGADRNEHRQASNLARLFLTVAGSRSVKVVNWYDFIDDGFNPGYVEESFGIVRRDFTIKPAYRACASVCRTFTRGTPALESRVIDNRTNLWIFRMGERAAVWTDGDEWTKIRLVSSGGMDLFNLMGEHLNGPGQSLSVDVNGDHPVIVRGRVDDVETNGGTIPR